MWQKTLFKISTLILVAAFALVTGCTNTASNSTPAPAPTGGSNANPQTTLKKESGGT
jgi:hypothetical protein